MTSSNFVQMLLQIGARLAPLTVSLSASRASRYSPVVVASDVFAS